MTLDFSTVININIAKQKHALTDPFKDKVFSVEQQDEMNKLFGMLQVDEAITFQELIHIVRVLNYQVSMRRLRSILQEITMTMNLQTKTPIMLVAQSDERFIDYRAFWEIITRVDAFHHKDMQESEDLERSLRIFKKDNIYIDNKFMDHVLKHIGEKVTDEEYQRLEDELIFDENGRAKFKDLLDTLSNK